MKTIKIRFIYYPNRDRYTIQRKTLFGWKDITRRIDFGYGSVIEYYAGSTKEDLLNVVLDDYYIVNKKHIRIVEYPELKYY
jgi:hypothetical protein